MFDSSPRCSIVCASKTAGSFAIGRRIRHEPRLRQQPRNYSGGAPQSAPGCLGLSYRRRRIGNHHAAQSFGLRQSWLTTASVSGRFEGRYVVDIPRAETSHPCDDGAHWLAANDHAGRRRGRGQSRGGVRHDEFPQLGDPTEPGRDCSYASTIRKFFNSTSAAAWTGAPKSSDG